MSKKVDLDAPRDNSGDNKKSRKIHSRHFSNPQNSENNHQNNQNESNKENNSPDKNDMDENSNDNNSNDNTTKNRTRGNLGRRAFTSLTGGVDGFGARALEFGDKIKGTIMLIKTIKFLPVILIALPILAALMLFVTILVDENNGSSGGFAMGIGGYDYYGSACSLVKLPDGTLLDIDEYIAGVLSREVGGFTPETIKTFAVAARTFAMANSPKVGSDPESCYYSIRSVTDNFQVYSPTTNETYIKAANETKGLIIVIDGKLKGGSYYDASCVYTAAQARNKDPGNTYSDDYYYIKYGGDFLPGVNFQPIPKSVASHVGSLMHWVNESSPCWGNHGNGLSQNGSYYLENYEHYTWDKIIDYYFNGTAQIMSIYKGASEGLMEYTSDYPIDPDNELYSNLQFLINKSFTDFLAEKGTNINEYNAFLKASVEKAGVGTRAGVVAAAVNLIGSLAESGVKLNYQWGGKYTHIGSYSKWGTVADMSYLCDVSYRDTPGTNSVSYCHENYTWQSFDCSGLVHWAVVNGMQNESITQSQTSYGSSISLDSSRAVCKPGGALESSGHIVLVVGTDDANKRYIVAEATGSNVSTGKGGVKLSYYSYGASGYRCSNLSEIYGD